MNAGLEGKSRRMIQATGQFSIDQNRLPKKELPKLRAQIGNREKEQNQGTKKEMFQPLRRRKGGLKRE